MPPFSGRARRRRRALPATCGSLLAAQAAPRDARAADRLRRWKPGRAPILVSVYSTGAARPMASRDRVIAETGRIIADTFGA